MCQLTLPGLTWGLLGPHLVYGQTGLRGDHVLKAVVVEPKNLQDPKLELVQAQVKNQGLVIANHALVRFHLHNSPIRQSIRI